MTFQIVQKKVSEYLTQADLIVINKNPQNIYSLPFEDSSGKFQGFHRIDSSVNNTWNVLKSENLGSQLLPIVTGG